MTARDSLAERIRRVAETAPAPSPADADRLRALLPPTRPARPAAAA